MEFLYATSSFSWQYLLIAIAFGLLLGLMFMNKNKVDKTKMSVLDLDEFLNTMRKGNLIDTRKAESFEAGKILGSRNYPGKSGAKNSAVRKDIPIFLYDEKGGASIEGIAKAYVKQGAVMVYTLKGGYQGYLKNKK